MFNLKAKVRRDTEKNLKKEDPILRHLELVCAIEYKDGTLTNKYKKGDGKTPFSELPYLNLIDDLSEFRILTTDGTGSVLVNLDGAKLLFEEP